MVTMVTIQKEHLSPLKYQEGVTRWRRTGRRVLGKEPNMKKKKKKTEAAIRPPCVWYGWRSGCVWVVREEAGASSHWRRVSVQ